MRYGPIADNPIERIGLAAGLAPTPIIDGYAGAFARAVMVATRIGVFEALKDGPLGAEAIAARCATHPTGTAKLLNLLVPMKYLRYGADDTYALGRVARKWMLADSPQSMRDVVLMKFVEWDWIEHFDEFVKTGEPLDVHGAMSPEDWALYQRGMRGQAGYAAAEVARRTPVPAGAREMLDVGGSHGFFSVAICRRHEGLRAVVMDLPEAIAEAAPLLAAEGMGDRVGHRAGDALTDDLGTAAYDLVLIFSLVHHFDEGTNRALTERAARALRPGGVLAIGESIRAKSPADADQLGAFFDLYFAVTSESGTWSFEEMADWQRAAGLRPRKPIRFMTLRGVGLQVADKPAA